MQKIGQMDQDQNLTVVSTAISWSSTTPAVIIMVRAMLSMLVATRVGGGYRSAGRGPVLAPPVHVRPVTRALLLLHLTSPRGRGTAARRPGSYRPTALTLLGRHVLVTITTTF